MDVFVKVASRNLPRSSGGVEMNQPAEFVGPRRHPATLKHPHECSYCDSAWAAVEFLEEHLFYDHPELGDENEPS